MTNLISYDGEQQVFHLKNQQISYLLAVEDFDLISHLYFGKAVENYHGQRKYPRVDRGFSGNLAGVEDRRYSQDTLLREYSMAGEGDYRTPAAKIVQADGSYALNFKFTGFEMFPGKPNLTGLPQAYVETDNEAETLVITSFDEVSQLELANYYTIYQDRPVIARSTQLRNLSNHSAVINKLASLQLDFAAEEFSVISLPGAHNKERQVQKEAIGYGIKKFGSRRGSTSHHMNNFIALEKGAADEFQGEVFGFNLVYSGNHSFEIERDQIDQLRLVAGINEEDFAWELNAGETFQTPEVLMVYSDQGLNKMSQAYHDLLTNRVARGKYRTAERSILVNNWEATYFDFTEEKLLPIVDAAAEVGIEMFVLDDGWYGQRNADNSSLGDWVVDKRKFPKGLNHFADYVHKKGLQFGLWMEPEMISIDSDLYREHPDYLMAYPGRTPAPSRSQHLLDLGRKEVRDNVFHQLSAIFDEGYVDYVKWDMNRSLSEVFSQQLAPSNQGEAFHRYILGLYELLENLVTKYPDILWEGCSGGGGRFDSGILHYMPQSWTSDNTDAVERLKIQYGTSLVYPPSAFTSHVSDIPNHQTGRKVSLETRGNAAMSSTFGYELDLTKLTKAEKQAVAEQVSLYKDIRQTVQFGQFARLKNPFTSNECAWQFIAQDKKEVLVMAFKILNQGQEPFSLLKLTGLEPTKTYQAENGELFGGDELMNLGFYLPQQTEDFSSWLYRFKLVD
ncbi:alpha-galactosidase [Enterococcus sp. LJL120]